MESAAPVFDRNDVKRIEALAEDVRSRIKRPSVAADEAAAPIPGHP